MVFVPMLAAAVAFATPAHAADTCKTSELALVEQLSRSQLGASRHAYIADDLGFTGDDLGVVFTFTALNADLGVVFDVGAGERVTAARAVIRKADTRTRLEVALTATPDGGFRVRITGTTSDGLTLDVRLVGARSEGGVNLSGTAQLGLFEGCYKYESRARETRKPLKYGQCWVFAG